MDTWGRYLISAAFVLHGLGMLGAGLYLPIAMRSEGDFGRSWLLSRWGERFSAITGTILWGLAGLGMMGAGVGLFLGASWWTAFGWLGAPATILAIALWFGAVPMGAYAGGILAALLLGALVFMR